MHLPQALGVYCALPCGALLWVDRSARSHRGVPLAVTKHDGQEAWHGRVSQGAWLAQPPHLGRGQPPQGDLHLSVLSNIFGP